MSRTGPAWMENGLMLCWAVSYTHLRGVAFDGWNNGIITKNEAREKLGMEPARCV